MLHTLLVVLGIVLVLFGILVVIVALAKHEPEHTNPNPAPRTDPAMRQVNPRSAQSNPLPRPRATAREYTWIGDPED